MARINAKSLGSVCALVLVAGLVLILALKSRESRVKVFNSKVQITLAPDETLVTGGWPFDRGTRVLVFITPVWIDSAGNRTQTLTGRSPQITMTAKFVEAPEQFLEKLGLKSLFAAKNDSVLSRKFTSGQMNRLMEKFKARDGVDILAAPKVVTLAGRQVHIASQEEQMIAGKATLMGPSIDLLPSVSADGNSVDLSGAVQIVKAAK